MKKLTLILAAMMVVAVNSIYAQNHRHTDRSNTIVVESIANSNSAALDTMTSPDIEEQFQDLVNDNTNFNTNSFSGDDSSIAKTAIVWVFGSLSILFLAPVLIVLIILYFRHKNNVMKNKVALAAIEKGVPIPEETKTTNEKTTVQPAANQQSKPIVSKMENAIKKLALGAGLSFGGWILHINILLAIGIGFIVYGIGLICIDLIFDHKND